MLVEVLELMEQFTCSSEVMLAPVMIFYNYHRMKQGDSEAQILLAGLLCYVRQCLLFIRVVFPTAPQWSQCGAQVLG